MPTNNDWHPLNITCMCSFAPNVRTECTRCWPDVSTMSTESHTDTDLIVDNLYRPDPYSGSILTPRTSDGAYSMEIHPYLAADLAESVRLDTTAVALTARQWFYVMAGLQALLGAGRELGATTPSNPYHATQDAVDDTLHAIHGALNPR